MIVVVNGMGCVETGAQIVLESLLLAAPREHRQVVFCTVETARRLRKLGFRESRENVLLIGLSHLIFGRVLRVPFEIFIALWAVLFRSSCIVNLSHYGYCLGGFYVLYIHSPVLMAEDSGGGWSDGKPNGIKRILLNSCLRRARQIILQTDGVAKQLTAYCAKRNIHPKRTRVVFPRPEPMNSGTAQRKYSFQLFYPTSRFSHKRIDLAEAAVTLLHTIRPDVGLVITTQSHEGSIELSQALHRIGRVSRDQVDNWYLGSDALLFTSQRETLGLPLLEALSIGLPVIVPDLPYAREILGDAGCYFYDATPAGVRDAIIRCMEDLDGWRSRTRSRNDFVRSKGLGWREHWALFLDFEKP